MDDGLDRQRGRAEQKVKAHEDRKQFKKAQNEEAVRAHLSGSVPQTEAHAAAEANADKYYIPPENEQEYSHNIRKVKGRPKGARDSSRVVRPDKNS